MIADKAPYVRRRIRGAARLQREGKVHVTVTRLRLQQRLDLRLVQRVHAGRIHQALKRVGHLLHRLALDERARPAQSFFRGGHLDRMCSPKSDAAFTISKLRTVSMILLSPRTFRLRHAADFAISRSMML